MNKYMMLSLMVMVLWVGAEATAKPLKIYILAGQSNMQGKASEGVLKGLTDSPETKPWYDKLVDEVGKPRVHEKVYVAAVSDGPTEKNGPLTIGFGSALTAKRGLRFGPELGFGVAMQEKLQEPILIIKTAWGGKTLNTDFRSPSAGPYMYNENVLDGLAKRKKMTKGEVIAAKAKATGHYYRLMLEQVRRVLADPGKFHPSYDPKQGVEIAGFVWFQGWNDMSDTHTYPNKGKPDQYKEYTTLLAHFIRDVRKDFKAPDMPFVIGVMGVGGEAIRPAMAAPAGMDEFKGNVVAVHTEKYLDHKLWELIDRGWRWQNTKWDPEKKYGELREKLKPLQKELAEARKLTDKKERSDRERDIQARIRKTLYTPDEEAYMANNKSSQGFHYLGSPKFFVRTGEAFARALIELEKK